VSVIIVSTGIATALCRALAAMATSRYAVAQVLVVGAGSAPAEAHPLILQCGAIYVAAPRGASIGELREFGMARATGDVVVIRQDDTFLDGGWLPCPDRDVTTSVLSASPEQRSVAASMRRARTAVDADASSAFGDVTEAVS
jgi:hypothetical protein